MTRQEAMIEMVKGNKITHPELIGVYELKDTMFMYAIDYAIDKEEFGEAFMPYKDGYEIYKEKKVRKLWFWRVKSNNGTWFILSGMYDDNGINGSGVNWSNWHNLEKQRLDVLGCVEVEE